MPFRNSTFLQYPYPPPGFCSSNRTLSEGLKSWIKKSRAPSTPTGQIIKKKNPQMKQKRNPFKPSSPLVDNAWVKVAGTKMTCVCPARHWDTFIALGNNSSCSLPFTDISFTSPRSINNSMCQRYYYNLFSWGGGNVELIPSKSKPSVLSSLIPTGPRTLSACFTWLECRKVGRLVSNGSRWSLSEVVLVWQWAPGFCPTSNQLHQLWKF